MANGLPSQVPSVPQRGGGKTYSQMVNEQLGLIQRQRAANFEQRLAQEQKNREFREEQLQNIYDFDVSGLASGDAKLLKQLQTELANSLDPNSENSYSSSRELVSDIAFINNVYGEMKRWGQTGGAGRQSYQQSILNPDRGDGTVFSGNEELLDKRNATWEQGAFASAEILGEAGNRQIIGNVLDQDGNVMQEGVDFFENVWRNRPDEFWRPEIAQGALLLDGVALDYASRSGVDNTNVVDFAGAVFDSDPNIYNRVVRERLIEINKRRAADGLPAITAENAQQLATEGLSEQDIRAEYIARAKEGIGLRPDPKPGKVDEDKTLAGQMNNLFGGAFAPADMPTVSADGTEGGPIGMPGSPTLSAPISSLNTGFDTMYELKSPIKSVGLPEDSSVVGFNVDGFGNMYVTIQKPAAQAEDANENLLEDGEPAMVFETIKLDPNSTDPMINGLYNTMKIRIPDQVVSYLMNLSRMNTSETGEVTPQEAARRTERADRERQLAEEEGLIQTSDEQGQQVPAFFEKGGVFRRFFGLS